MSEWQPIESAPKDGTKVLAFGPHVNNREGSYIEVTPYWNGLHPRWSVEWMDGFGKPTHWQPLPAPPASGEQQ